LDAIGFVWDARKKRPTQDPDMWNTLPKAQGGSVGSGGSTSNTALTTTDPSVLDGTTTDTLGHARKKRPTQAPDMWNTLPKTQGGSVGSMVTTRSRSDINVENERMSNQHLSPTSRLNKELEVQRIPRKNNKKSSRLTTHS